MSKKLRAYTKSQMGVEHKKGFYAGWDAAEALYKGASDELVAFVDAVIKLMGRYSANEIDAGMVVAWLDIHINDCQAEGSIRTATKRAKG